MNKKGVTLIEMLIVIAIIGIIAGIAYPILSMSNTRATTELEDSFQRNEVRAITNFLKEDIRDSIKIDFLEIEETKEFKSIIYYAEGPSVIYTNIGYDHVIRSQSEKEKEFLEIKKAKIYDFNLNEELVQVELFLDEESADQDWYKFKIARWRWKIPPPDGGDSIYDLIENEDLFVIGAGFAMAGNIVTGNGASIYLDSNLLGKDLNDGTQIRVSNVYITGDVDLSNGEGLGSITDPGNILVEGNIKLDGGADIYGDVYVQGNLDLMNGSLHGNIYVQGDFNFTNGSVYGDVYVNGNLHIKDGKLNNGNIYVNQNVTVDWQPKIQMGSMVYYYGKISYPAYFDVSQFEQIATLVPVLKKLLPKVGVPAPKLPQWYEENGYILNGPLVNDAKIYVTSGDYIKTPPDETISNVIVVNLAGKINIQGGGLNLSGVMYSPYGHVTIGGKSFTGFIIASEGANMSAGGMEITFEDIKTYISDSSQYPFLNEIIVP